MGTTLYVTLNPLLDGSEGHEGDLTVLFRQLDHKYKEKRVKDIIYKVLDHEKDEMNEAYVGADLQTAHTIKAWLDNYQVNPDTGAVKILVLSNSTPKEEIPVLLSETLVDKLESVVQHCEGETGSDQPMRYDKIEFEVHRISGGGYSPR
ncbi:MAG: hypothetical protein KJ709_08430 [Nanoarchaeota archaeon]|nr:hypothetical protein [Nanoarchaeota archaeon]